MAHFDSGMKKSQAAAHLRDATDSCRDGAWEARTVTPYVQFDQLKRHAFSTDIERSPGAHQATGVKSRTREFPCPTWTRPDLIRPGPRRFRVPRSRSRTPELLTR
jgi:hypothetical protein